MDRQPAGPRRVPVPTVLLTVASGLDGGSYILGAALSIGLAGWAALGSDGSALGIVIVLLAIGAACIGLVAYRVATLTIAVRRGTAVAVEAVGVPVRVPPTFTPWGDVSGIGDRQGAGAYEISFRAVASGESGSIRLQESWVRSLQSGSPLWLLTHGRRRLIAPRRG